MLSKKNKILIFVIGLMVFGPTISLAQDPEFKSVHWAYGAFLGTGWYSKDDNRDVYILRIPPRWNFRRASIDESGQRKLGIELHFPLTFGLHKLEEIGDVIDFDNFGTVSLNPGVEIEYPVSDRWRLRAYTHLGWGTEIGSSDNAWIYDAGLKSRIAFNHGKLDWGFMNELFFAGYNANNTGKDSLGGLTAFLDFSYPVSMGSGAGRALLFKWDVGYRWYENDLSFPRGATDTDSIGGEWEVGMALARQAGPIKIWFLNFEHMGLIYRFNTDGSFKAITVNFRSPFTR